MDQQAVSTAIWLTVATFWGPPALVLSWLAMHMDSIRWSIGTHAISLPFYFLCYLSLALAFGG